MSRSFHVALILLLMVPVSGWAQNVPAPESVRIEFIKLLTQAQHGTMVDYGALRMAYAKTPWYHPYETEASMRDRMLRSFEAQNYLEALGAAKFLLGQNLNFLDIQAHEVAERASEKLGQMQEAQAHRRHYRGLVDSILASGDGKSPTSAYVIISIQEMDALLQHLGLSRSSESRTTHSEKDACLVRVSARDSRQAEDEVYFKMTAPCVQVERHSQRR